MPFPPGTRVRALIAPGEPPPAAPMVLKRWEEMCQSIPRLFNAPLLSVTSIDRPDATIHCRRDTYQRLVVQPEVQTGVEQLSVTGVLIARNDQGQRCLLLGQRSSETRMYAGMWELGPAGGVDAPDPPSRALTHDDLVEELVREIREETGLDVAGRAAAALGIIHDPQAHSYDLTFLMDLGEIPDTSHDNWEYKHIQWLPFADIRQFLTTPDEEIIPPTRLLLQLLSDGEF